MECHVKCEKKNDGTWDETCQYQYPIRNVILNQKCSVSACIKDVGFGISADGKSIWVDNGCRASFTVTIEQEVLVQYIEGM